jgi:glycosyltransferase involved in cell wall biosynthesis
MRILFWSYVFWPKIGGVEVHAGKLLPSLKSRGYEFLVVTTKSHSDEPDTHLYHGIPIHRFPFWDSTSYRDVDSMARIRQKIIALKRTFAPDLIHINAIDIGNWFHTLTSNVSRAPLLVTLHGEWMSRDDRVVERTLRDADWVTGCSRAILDKGRQLVPEIISRSSIIYNGLDSPTHSPEPLPFEEPRLLCLGRLSPEKGFDLAVEAFDLVLRRFPKARLMISGDGPSRLELERMVAQKKLEQSVDFLGWVKPENVPALINSSTLVVMPSRQESLPLVALEAALMERPVLATWVGGLPEVVVHEQTGLLVKPDDSHALTEAVAYLLHRPELAVRIGQNARRWAEQKFNWQTHVDGYDELYKELTAKSTSKRLESRL